MDGHVIKRTVDRGFAGKRFSSSDHERKDIMMDDPAQQSA